MPYVRIELWPSATALLVAAVLMAIMRVLEGYSHRATVMRTREAIQHALRGHAEE